VALGRDEQLARERVVEICEVMLAEATTVHRRYGSKGEPPRDRPRGEEEGGTARREEADSGTRDRASSSA
jgi:hypothetical protein